MLKIISLLVAVVLLSASAYSMVINKPVKCYPVDEFNKFVSDNGFKLFAFVQDDLFRIVMVDKDNDVMIVNADSKFEMVCIVDYLSGATINKQIFSQPL